MTKDTIIENDTIDIEALEILLNRINTAYKRIEAIFSNSNEYIPITRWNL